MSSSELEDELLDELLEELLLELLEELDEDELELLDESCFRRASRRFSISRLFSAFRLSALELFRRRFSSSTRGSGFSTGFFKKSGFWDFF